jgi:hypothetical protein
VATAVSKKRILIPFDFLNSCANYVTQNLTVCELNHQLEQHKADFVSSLYNIGQAIAHKQAEIDCTIKEFYTENSYRNELYTCVVFTKFSRS